MRSEGAVIFLPALHAYAVTAIAGAILGREPRPLRQYFYELASR
ncbi:MULTISPECIES: hypothetical protein [unclassified Nostoc]|nr:MULTISPECIES: hypothetical protein [unclassified Nostoc]